MWSEFDAKFKSNPFPKVDESGYEIRFFDAGKPVVKGKDVHVGFVTETAISGSDFTSFVLPASEYAVFEVYVAKGYDSGNEEMSAWLEKNKTVSGSLTKPYIKIEKPGKPSKWVTFYALLAEKEKIIR